MDLRAVIQTRMKIYSAVEVPIMSRETEIGKVKQTVFMGQAMNIY